MKKIYVFILVLALAWHPSFSQPLRTDVCVYGNSLAALSAGIQSARSGVKTLLVTNKNQWLETVHLSDFEKSDIPSAIGAEILKKYTQVEKHKSLHADSLLQSIQALSDTVKNLKIIGAAAITEIKQAGKGWEIRLSNGEKIKTSLVIDADKAHVISQKLNLSPAGSGIAFEPNNLLMRTSVATLGATTILPLHALLFEKMTNIIVIPKSESAFAQLNAGQAAGATAAYCAFFKTNTERVNVRLIQGELLTYKATLLPFEEVQQSDSNFVAIQHVALTGLLNSGIQQKGDKQLWMGNQGITAEVLKTPMKKLYSRSQIWFADHANTTDLTIGDAIGLITYTATRGKELRTEIENGWKTALKFSGTFDEKRKISRSEFSVLLEAYLQPFATQVDLQGEFIN